MHILHLPCKEEKTMEQWYCSFHYILRNVHCLLVWKSSELMTIRKAQSCYEISFLFVMTTLYVGYECCTQILWNEQVFTSEHIFLMIFSKKTEDFFSWQYVRRPKLTKWTLHIRTFFLMIFSDEIFLTNLNKFSLTKLKKFQINQNVESLHLRTFALMLFL